MSLFGFLRSKRGPVSRVHMVASVDQLIAGESYDIPVELADRFILRGYAEGHLSRPYSADERSAMLANHQVVGL